MTDITPEALEERGFELDVYNIWRKTVESKDGVFHLSWKVRSGIAYFYVLIGTTAFTLPGIHSLADVDAMIRFLEGGETTNESEAR